MDVLCDAIIYSGHPGVGSDGTDRSDKPNNPTNININNLNNTDTTLQRRLSHTSAAAGSNVVSGNGSNGPAPAHRCHLCGRAYERADHLNRHLKSHENARPHKCTRCPKSFNRADLLNRHQASHERHANGDVEKPRIERGDRVAAACVGCVASKAKCQDQKPCLRCLRKKIPCETSGGNNSTQNTSRSLGGSVDRRRERSLTSPLVASSTNVKTEYIRNMSSSQQAGETFHNHQGMQYTTGAMFDPNMPRGIPLDNNLTSHQHNPANAIVHRESLAVPSAPTFYNEGTSSNAAPPAFYDEPFQDFGYIPMEGQNFGLTPRDAYFSQDLDFGVWDIDLDSVELQYQNAPTPNQLRRADSTSRAAESPAVAKDVSKRYAAFERSPWIWKPTQKDQTMKDSSNLNLDEESIPTILTPASPTASMDEFLSCCINTKMRDQMLGLVLSVGKGSSKAPSYPSLNLLNNIIQVYFVQASFYVDNFIHAPTLNPEKTLPHLLTAVVAAGTSYISTPAIWKMGLALQEVVRHAVAEYWEHNNSKTRNLQAIQAFLLGLDIGLWSGFKRNMELAESFAQPITIMLRRAGAFGAGKDPQVLWPERNDTEAVVETKWKKWAERESFKRLVLHLFVHDTTASLGFQKPPLISFTELKFDLPASRHLWNAKTAMEWRDVHLANPPAFGRLPTFLELMQSTDILSQLLPTIDTPLCAVTLLYGFWGQIWSLLESKKFYPASKATHRLCLLTSHTELYRDLGDFAARVPLLTRNSPDATLLAEVLMMIMHAPQEDLQRFAGKFGEDEAARAANEFQTWARTTEARIAVWHAGQVFRAAKRLMPTQLRGFNAIAVYYASLTLWVFGLNTQDSATSRRQATSGPEVVLNENETLLTRQFRANDEGIPGLHVFDEDRRITFVALDATDRILSVARDIYRHNFPVIEEPLPPLVENMGTLLRDLSSMPGSRVSRSVSESAG